MERRSLTSRYHGSKISGSQKIASLSNGNFAVRTGKKRQVYISKTTTWAPDKSKPRCSPHNEKNTLYPCFTGRMKSVYSWSITRNLEDRGFNWRRSRYASYGSSSTIDRASPTHPEIFAIRISFFVLFCFVFFWGGGVGVVKLKFWKASLAAVD